MLNLIQSKNHDIFNLCALLPIIFITLGYFVFDPTINNLLLPYYFIISILYLFVDMSIIYFYPNCVGNNVVLMIHHFFALCLIGYVYQIEEDKLRSFFYHLQLGEVTSWLLIAKRNFNYNFLDNMFYLSWIIIRLIIYPRIFLIYYPVKNYSIYPKIMVLSLCIMNYVWTFKLFKKNKYLESKINKFKQLQISEKHDLYNIITLLPIVIFTVYQLISSSAYETYYLYFLTIVAYIVSDIIWIFKYPKSVKSPNVILFHHVIMLLLTLYQNQNSKYAVLLYKSMIIEFSTWLLIVKRFFKETLNQHYLIKKYINYIHYTSWILIRNFYVPYVLIYESYQVMGSYLVLFGSCIISLLQYFWTYKYLNTMYKDVQL